MHYAPAISGKHNNTSDADMKVNDWVPHEETYKVELFQLLTSALPPSFTKNIDLNGPRVVVSNMQKEHVVVEVVAHECDGPANQKGSVLERIRRCAKIFTQIKGVREAWVSSSPHSLYHYRHYRYRYHSHAHTLTLRY